MKLKEIELRIIHLPLVRPFRTSFGTQTSREVLMVKVTNENGTIGWAECVAMSEPLYSPEYVAGCLDLMKKFYSMIMKELLLKLNFIKMVSMYLPAKTEALMQQSFQTIWQTWLIDTRLFRSKMVWMRVTGMAGRY